VTNSLTGAHKWFKYPNTPGIQQVPGVFTFRMWISGQYVVKIAPRIAPLAEVKARFSAFINSCRESGAPVIVTRNGRPVAVLMPLNDDDLDSFALSANPKFQSMLQRSYDSIRKTGGIPDEAFWQRVEADESKQPVQHG